jgi:hypothetical protein
MPRIRKRATPNAPAAKFLRVRKRARKRCGLPPLLDGPFAETKEWLAGSSSRRMEKQPPRAQGGNE